LLRVSFVDDDDDDDGDDGDCILVAVATVVASIAVDEDDLVELGDDCEI